MKKERRMYYKPGGYETDHLIHDLTDEQLLSHMDVPMRFIDYAVEMEGLPKEVEKWLENLPYIFRPSYANAKEKHLCGTGLIFHGPTGTRKTTMAVATLLRTIRKEIKNSDPTGRNATWHGAAMGRFIDWQEASEIFRTANSGDETAELTASEIRTAMQPLGPVINRADFLVLDDISRERPTEYNTTELHRVLRHRADNGYPTILTTNQAPEDWMKTHGEVLYGYLCRTFVMVEFE